MANYHPEPHPENLRPPWPKGKSPNPGGRPKGQPSLTTLLRHEMKRVAPKEGKKTVAQRIIEAMVEHAISGNAGYMKEIMNRLEGAAPALPEAEPPDHRPRDADGNPIPA